MTVLTVTRYADGQVLHTGTDLTAALAVLDAAGHARAVLSTAPAVDVEPVAPPTSLPGAVEPLLPLAGWPTPARVVGRGASARVDVDAVALF